ncbi:MAG: beta-lactamase family protein [Pleurocapsa sp. SU_196_0]|nr:beta-lactamase family protein [Pleurocapsa sp. SU_196_0]
MHPAFDVVAQHLETHPIPGAAAAVLRGDSIETFTTGHLWHTPDAPPVTLETVWDLASLTKVLVTVPLLLKLWETGGLDLEAPLSDALPEVRGFALETATVLQLVAHTSGLEALSRVRFWNLSRDAALRRALEEPRPMTGIVYSDQGFIVLTRLLERLYDARIDVVTERELFSPVGANLTYHPNPLLWRRHGVRHHRGSPAARHRSRREHPCARGGVGTRGVVRCSARSREVHPRPDGRTRFATRDARAHGSADSSHGNDARGFGWVARHDGWLGGERAAMSALGHTGFTGTGIWFDLETMHANVLLTNRVCPSRDQPSEIAALRRAFNDAAW